MAGPGATSQGSGAICHTFSQQSFLESCSASTRVAQPWVSQLCETLFNYLKRKKKETSESAKKAQHHSIAIFNFCIQPFPPHINMKRKTDNAMIVLVNTTVQLSFHAHLHFYSRKRVTHLRELKEWELIFPTPLSNKATRLDSIISVSKDLHYPTCMGTVHLTNLTKAIHSYI